MHTFSKCSPTLYTMYSESRCTPSPSAALHCTLCIVRAGAHLLQVQPYIVHYVYSESRCTPSPSAALHCTLCIVRAGAHLLQVLLLCCSFKCILNEFNSGGSRLVVLVRRDSYMTACMLQLTMDKFRSLFLLLFIFHCRDS